MNMKPGYLWAQFWHTRGKRDKDPSFRIRPAIEVLKTVGKLPSGAKVLDVGCRNEKEPTLLRMAGWRVTAVDLFPPLFSSIRRADMHDLPFPDMAFDAVVASHVLEHAHTPALALHEIAWAVVPGGLIWAAWPRNFIPNAHDRFDYGDAASFRHLLSLHGMRAVEILWFDNQETESRVLVRLH